MKKGGRYDTSALIEDQYEHGSNKRVLRNKLGIKTKREMNLIEKQELLRVMNEVLGIFDKTHRFTADDICWIHKIWFGNIYEWAGKYRQVNVSKGNFPFAPAAQVPKLMEEFEKGPLRKFTPCNFDTFKAIAEALAVVHAELVLIHPFREGNGRVARLLADLMSAQAELPPLDFSGLTGMKKKAYISAIQASLGHDYDPMRKLFELVIRKTLRIRG